MEREYDPADDSRRSYDAAVEAKRARGDTHWPERSPIKREVVIGDCRLLLGDCLEILPTLGKVDAVVTDPPYGMNLAGISGTRSSRAKLADLQDYRIEGDDEPFDPSHLLRLKAPRMVLWGANHYASRLPDNRKWIVWDKRAGGTPDNQADCELAWTNLSGPERMHIQLWRGMVRAGEENVATGSYRNHPAQKPIALMDACLGHCGLQAGDTVLDPYMGTGACGIAAARRGIRYIGIELDEGYFEIACERIRKAYAQPDFFVEQSKAPEPVQQPLFAGDAA